MAFHEGEQAVQARAGLRAQAERVGRGIYDAIHPAAREFLAEQRMAIAATVDGQGQVWASMLTGEPGFLDAPDERTLRVAALPAEGDPLRANLAANPAIGLLVIQPALRLRVRVNGAAELTPGGLTIRVRQAYGNCQKYIQARLAEPAQRGLAEARRGGALTEAQQAWIGRADTFFIASFHPEGGADASHRGGMPGFIRVLGEDRLEFPDYPGNTMFNTLGNLEANPSCGLLFVDFESGALLQLAGQAHIDWDPAHAAQYPGAERVAQFRVAQTVEIANGLPLRFEFLQASPFNAPAWGRDSRSA